MSQVHGGVDFHAEAGTAVVAPFRGRLRYRGSPIGGVGHVVVFEAEDASIHLIMMHLMTEGAPGVGTGIVEAGTPIGTVGRACENGGWLPHLHVSVLYGPYPGTPESAWWIDAAYSRADELCVHANPLELFDGVCRRRTMRTGSTSRLNEPHHQNYHDPGGRQSVEGQCALHGVDGYQTPGYAERCMAQDTGREERCDNLSTNDDPDGTVDDGLSVTTCERHRPGVWRPACNAGEVAHRYRVSCMNS